MIDLSEESLHENIEICSKYLARMAKMGMTLEIELGLSLIHILLRHFQLRRPGL